MMTDKKMHGIIGLAVRAGQVVLGEAMTIHAIRSHEAEIAFLDDSAACNAVKKIADACEYHFVPLVIIKSGILESATGKEGRKAAAILKGTFAKQVLSILSQTQNDSSYSLYSRSLSHNAGVHVTNDQG